MQKRSDGTDADPRIIQKNSVAMRGIQVERQIVETYGEIGGVRMQRAEWLAPRSLTIQRRLIDSSRNN
jgi:hypothetical protein